MRSVRVQRRAPPPRLAWPALAVLLLACGCGPRPAETPPIQRGTALPPPGVSIAPGR